MLRSLAPFADGEELYRLVKTQDIDGDRIKESAIDTNGGARGTSFFRSGFCPLADVPIAASVPRVARMLATDMPDPLVDSNDAVWSFFVADDPVGHIAHAEVRYRKRGSVDPRGDRIKSPRTRILIREALADKLRLCPFPMIE